MILRTLATLSMMTISAFPQTISPNGIVNGASFLPAVAPGSVISIFGSNLATGNAGASSVPLPITLGGTDVKVNGTPAPLFFVSPSQINAQLPYEIAPGPATLVVTVNGSSTAPMAFTVMDAAPGILVYGSNRAVAINQDSTLNSPDKPALPNSVVTVYVVGQGPVDTAVTTGAPSPGAPVAHATQPVSAVIGGRDAPVQFQGLSPGGIGLFQVNLQVPALAAGDSALVITIGGAESNTAMLAVSGPNQTPSPTTIVRTIAYHQLTSLPDAGGDMRNSTILSGNGAVIAFDRSPGSTQASSPNQIFTMNFDGTGQTLIDSYTTQCFCGSTVDISDRATKVVSTEGLQIRLVDSQGVHPLVDVDTGVSGIKIEGDGNRVFFLLGRDQNFIGSGGATSGVQRGLYVINADGSGLRQIVGPDAVAGLFGGVTESYYNPEFTITATGPGHALSVTADGLHIVFGAKTWGPNGADAMFGVNLDGSGLHMIIGPVPYVHHIAMSSNASKVLYNATFSGFDMETGVINFDGTGRLPLRTDGIDGAGGVQLTADGSQLLAADILYNTDGSGAQQLSTTFNDLTPGNPVMNATATRFVYSFVYPGTYSQGLTQLASAEIDPVSLGAAPVIVDPVLRPEYVIPDGSFTGMVTARMTASGSVIGLHFALVRDGLLEDPHDADSTLVDDGTNGDAVAGDGIYTSNNLHAPSDYPVAPRVLRLFGEVQDAAGLHHGTVVDVAPFFVVAQTPTGPAPQIGSVSPSSGAAGTKLTIAGSGFDGVPANDQAIVGSRLAQVLSATSTQLIVVVPSGVVTGAGSLTVSAGGQTSNAVAFTAN
jgi:uncharacterized protein (TIGR03437 family)